MATVNINRKVSDNFYRYKMPKIQSKIEGRGNGIKTVVPNLAEVSKALKRPTLYTLKYLGCELGAQTRSDEKNDRYIINGSHDSEKLQNVLDGFIDRFVLCPGCGNPETNLVVLPKKEKINMDCIACGYHCSVPTNHRVSTFILKNPPKNEKKQKTKENDSKNTNKETTKIAEKCETNNYIENSTEPTAAEMDLWNKMSSEAEIKKRQADLPSHLNGVTVNSDMEKSTNSRLEILSNFIHNKLQTNGNLEAHFVDILAESSRLNLGKRFIFAVSHNVLDKEIATQIQTHHAALAKFMANDERIQRYFLGSVEQIIHENLELLLPRVLFIFKFLYDQEVVSEEVFLDWNDSKSSKFVTDDTLQKLKSSASEFITWLKDADEESSSGEEEEEDVDDSETHDDCTGTATDDSKFIGSPADDDRTHELDQGGSDIDIDDI